MPDALVQKILGDPRIAVEESAMDIIYVEPSTLWPAERAAISQAVPKRRREFAAGRILARRALARLGLDNVEIAVRYDRLPIWPEGFIGSITHTDTWCAAAVAPRKEFAGIGIDVEQADRLDQSLWRHVLTDNELERLEAYPQTERGSIALLIFSAKESAFKAQYLLSGRFLDFHAMEITLDLAGSGFGATLAIPVESMFPAGHQFSGHFLRQGKIIATAVTIAVNSKPSM